jgi:hypothetical protein
MTMSMLADGVGSVWGGGGAILTKARKSTVVILLYLVVFCLLNEKLPNAVDII